MQFSFVNTGFSSASSSPFRVYLISLKWNSSPPPHPLALFYPLSVAIPADSYIAELYTHHSDTATRLQAHMSAQASLSFTLHFHNDVFTPPASNIPRSNTARCEYKRDIRSDSHYGYAHSTLTVPSRYVHVHSRYSLLCLVSSVRDRTMS